jgi:hypothetical protein
MASTAGYMIQNSSPTFSASNAFHHYHQAIVNGAVQGFLPDTMKGIGAYSEAAETAAINYASLDQLGTLDMSKVGDEMQKNPAMMYELMSPALGAKGNARVNMDYTDVNNVFNPTKDDLPKPDDTTPTDANGPAGKGTTQQDIDAAWNKQVTQSQTDLKDHPDGSTLSQQQRDQLYGDHSYTVPNSNGVVVPQNTVTKSDIEGPVAPDNPLK